MKLVNRKDSNAERYIQCYELLVSIYKNTSHQNSAMCNLIEKLAKEH